MRKRVICVGLLFLAACGGGSAAPQPDGPPSLSVLAGNHQTVTAAPRVALPTQVVAQVVRLPNGTVGMTTRVLDALLPAKAYAQTAVNGIPGAVVCAVAPDPLHPLTPEVPCTNTDVFGKAYFTFHADSVAGIARSQVRGTVNGVTQVSDSVEATVMALAAAQWGTPYSTLSPLKAGDTIFVRRDLVNPVVLDKYGNQITSYLVRYRRINTADSLTDAQLIASDKAVARVGDYQLIVAVDSVQKSDFALHVSP